MYSRCGFQLSILKSEFCLIHAFRVADKSHPQTKDIYAMLEILTGQMKVASYVSNVDFVLHKVEDEAEELTHCSNNEELAISFGNLNTGSGTCIQISNDLFAW